MRLKLTLSYDGTDYCGWQKQKNGLSVQQTVEDAIFSLTGERVSLIGSGRTDAGVHAAGQVAHFDTGSGIPAENFYKAINTLLPKDVKAVDCKVAADDFNARSSAKRKTYEYTLYRSDVVLPLKERYSSRIYGDVSVEKMKNAAKLLVGEHDFKSFSATGGKVKTTVRKIYALSVTEKDKEIKIRVCGNGFLYNMVRIIAGTLVAVGKGEISEKEISAALCGGKRETLGATLPAKGLCLLSVEYD